MNESIRFHRLSGRVSDKVLIILLVVCSALFIRSLAIRIIGEPPATSEEARVATVVPAAPEQVASVPVRLRIPAIGVDANIQPLGLTDDGQLDVPKGDNRYIDVGWYSLGAKPGEKGTAVMDGHLDTRSLIDPGVFRDLDKLEMGDVVEVVDDRGTLFRYRVTGSKELLANADTTEVFESATGSAAHLNLITCSGDWQQSQRQYDKRLVVFTELIP